MFWIIHLDRGGGGGHQAAQTQRGDCQHAQRQSETVVLHRLALNQINNTPRWQTASIVTEGAPFSPTASIA